MSKNIRNSSMGIINIDLQSLQGTTGPTGMAGQTGSTGAIGPEGLPVTSTVSLAISGALTPQAIDVTFTKWGNIVFLSLPSAQNL